MTALIYDILEALVLAESCHCILSAIECVASLLLRQRICQVQILTEQVFGLISEPFLPAAIFLEKVHSRSIL